MLQLRLPPDTAWVARFRDLAAALEMLARPAATPARDDLARLMARYPDRSNR